jgi:acetyl esterase/lipase
MNPTTSVLDKCLPSLKSLVAVGCMATVVSAQAPAQQSRPKTIAEIVNMPVVYRVPGMDQVTVRSNLKYTKADDPNLLMVVDSPPGLAKGDLRPAVIFIHGGAGSQSRPKDWGFYRSWGRLVAASGMVGVTFTHRLGYPKPLLAESSSDVTAAIEYVRANADSLNIDKDRVCLASYSAGGPLLSMAMRDGPGYVRCLVAFYSFLDIQQSESHRKYETPEMIKAFSPITYLANDADKIAPMFIARGGMDQIPTMDDSIDRFVREAISKNAAITFANHPQGVHGFDSQNDDDRYREIIQDAIAFMKLHLGVK